MVKNKFIKSVINFIKKQETLDYHKIMHKPSADFAFENSRLFRAMVTLPHQCLLAVLPENIANELKFGEQSQQQRLLTPCRTFFLFYQMLFFCRLLFLSFCLLEEHHGWPLFWIIDRADPLLKTINSEVTFNAMFGFCLAPLVIFGLALEVLLYVKPELYFWKLFYDLMIENERHFWSLNPKVHYLSISLNPLSPVESLAEIKAYIYKLWRYEKPVFASRLLHFPHVHPSVRYKILIISVVYRQFIKVALLAQSTFLFLSWLGLVYLLSKYYHLLSLYFLLGALDVGLVLYVFKRGFVQLNFFLFLLVLLMSTCSMHLWWLNGKLMKAVGVSSSSAKSFRKLDVKYRKKTPPARMEKMLYLARFYRSEQLTIVLTVYRLNEVFVSLLTFIGIGSNVLANIYLVSSLVFDGPSMSLHYQVILVVGILTQIGGIYIVALPMIVLSNTLYSGTRYLFTVQRRLHWPFVGEKLALSHYYELLNTDEPVVFKLGYIGSFTNDWLLQVRLFAEFMVEQVFNSFFSLFLSLTSS